MPCSEAVGLAPWGKGLSFLGKSTTTPYCTVAHFILTHDLQKNIWNAQVHYAFIFVLCVYIAATPFSISEFLKKHETEFFKVVYPKLSLLRLIRKGVITEDVKSKIDASNTEDGQEILFSHLKHHADVDSLMEYCEVVIAADGYPNMQALGKKLKKELQQGGWFELCACTCCVWTLCVPPDLYLCLNVCLLASVCERFMFGM